MEARKRMRTADGSQYCETIFNERRSREAPKGIKQALA